MRVTAFAVLLMSIVYGSLLLMLEIKVHNLEHRAYAQEQVMDAVWDYLKAEAKP